MSRLSSALELTEVLATTSQGVKEVSKTASTVKLASAASSALAAAAQHNPAVQGRHLANFKACVTVTAVFVRPGLQQLVVGAAAACLNQTATYFLLKIATA